MTNSGSSPSVTNSGSSSSVVNSYATSHPPYPSSTPGSTSGTGQSTAISQLIGDVSASPSCHVDTNKQKVNPLIMYLQLPKTIAKVKELTASLNTRAVTGG